MSDEGDVVCMLYGELAFFPSPSTAGHARGSTPASPVRSWGLPNPDSYPRPLVTRTEPPRPPRQERKKERIPGWPREGILPGSRNVDHRKNSSQQQPASVDLVV